MRILAAVFLGILIAGGAVFFGPAAIRCPAMDILNRPSHGCTNLADQKPAAPNLQEEAYQTGLRMTEAKRYKDSIPFYRQALTLDPNDSRAQYNLGLSLLQTEDYAGAAVQFADYLANPGKPADVKFIAGAHAYRGQSLARLGSFDAALTEANSGISADPTSAQALYSRAIVHHLAKNYDLALADVDAAIQRDSSDTYFREEKILLLSAAEKYDAALLALDEVQKIAGDTGWVAAERAYLTYRKGYLKSAIKLADHATEVDPKRALAYWTRGVANGDLGDFASALRDMRQAKTLGDTTADKWITFYTAKAAATQ